MDTESRIGLYHPSPEELDLINKYGFRVVALGEEFVVSHPVPRVNAKLGKERRANLLQALTIMATAYDRNYGDAVHPNKVIIKVSDIKTKKKKPHKRCADRAKFLSAFKEWLANPSATPTVITNTLNDKGIDIPQNSVVMLKHMIATAVRVQIELGILHIDIFAGARKRKFRESDKKKFYCTMREWFLNFDAEPLLIKEVLISQNVDVADSSIIMLKFMVGIAIQAELDLGIITPGVIEQQRGRWLSLAAE